MADVSDLDMAHADKSRKSFRGRAIRFPCVNAGHLLRRDDHHPLKNMRRGSIGYRVGQRYRRPAYARRGCR